MPSALPTENTVNKAVDTFGIGTYDSQRDENGDHGENSEKREPAGRTLPDDATKSPQTNDPEEWLSYPNEPESRTVTNIVSFSQQQQQDDEEDEIPMQGVFNPDRELNYPDSADARLGTLWHRGFIAVAEMPGDVDGNFQHFHPQIETYDARVESSAGAKKSILPQEQGVDGRDPGAMNASKRKKTSEEQEAHSELPSDANNPSARTDYFDWTHPVHTGAGPAENVRKRKEKRPDLYCPKCLWMTGGGPCPRHGGPAWTKEREEEARKKSREGSSRQALFSDYIAPSEDSGAYTGQEKKEADTELPGPYKNEEILEDWLQSLGNYWSGTEIEDISDPYGFPAPKFNENIEFDRSDNQDGGTIVPLGDPKMFASGRTSMTTRQATNIHQVVALTKDFLKEAGKEDLTKRHVLAFLQQKGLPQYLSSDIIRCLKLSHDIHVKDVLDEFPVYRQASIVAKTSIAHMRRAFIELECKHVLQPEVSSVFRRCAANLTHVLLDMEKLAKTAAEKYEPSEADEKNCQEAYKEYCQECKDSGREPISHEEFHREFFDLD